MTSTQNLMRGSLALLTRIHPGRITSPPSAFPSIAKLHHRRSYFSRSARRLTCCNRVRIRVLRKLLAAHVPGVPFVLADVFDQFRVGHHVELNRSGPGVGIGL